MHEMSIAVALMGQLEAVAADNGLRRIERVVVVAGQMRAVVPEALEMAFAAVAEGTAAAGARLEIEIEPAEARCRRCNRRFAPTADSFLCPGCGQADVALTAGNDVVLASVVGEPAEGASCDED